jgi:hypothetical protein
MPLPSRHAPNATIGTGAYHVQFNVPAGEYLMRVVVREPGGLVGSADRRFTVRALDGPALTSGDLVLSSTRGDLPARPTAYIGDGLSGVLELYARTVDQLRDARVAVDLVPMGATVPALAGFADLREIRPTTTGAAREARVELPLQGVTPGTYIARARVTVGADTVTEVVREIDVRPGERPAGDDAEARAAFDRAARSSTARWRAVTASLRGQSSAAAAAALRGLDRLGAGDYPAAIAAFEEALSAEVRPKPDTTTRVRPPLVASGFSRTTQKRQPRSSSAGPFTAPATDRQAISAWRRAACVNPSIVCHLALADIYAQLAQPALAIQALRAGLAALPDSPELRDRLSRLEPR